MHALARATTGVPWAESVSTIRSPRPMPSPARSLSASIDKAAFSACSGAQSVTFSDDEGRVLGQSHQSTSPSDDEACAYTEHDKSQHGLSFSSPERGGSERGCGQSVTFSDDDMPASGGGLGGRVSFSTDKSVSTDNSGLCLSVWERTRAKDSARERGREREGKNNSSGRGMRERRCRNECCG